MGQQTLFPEGSRASRSQLPGSDAARRMTATSGRKCSESFPMSGPLGLLVKTLMASSAWGSGLAFLKWRVETLNEQRISTVSEEYLHEKKCCSSSRSSTILKRWGTGRSRLLFRLVASMPRTSDTGSGLWATPTGQDGTRGNQPARPWDTGVPLSQQVVMRMWPTPLEGDATGSRGSKGKDRPNEGGLRKAVKMTPTPSASMMTMADMEQARFSGNGGKRPSYQEVKMWPTPRAEDSEQTGGHRGSPDTLTSAARMWPTPKSEPSKPDFARAGREGSGGDDLATAVARMFPTPTVQDAENCGGPSQSERNTPPLNAVAGGSLNPQFVEWLMGYPLGWTDCEVSETPSSPKSPTKS